MILGMGFNWGIGEWAIILAIVLIFFGVGKLPQVLGQMGKGVRAFKDGMNTKDDEPRTREIDYDEADELERPRRKAKAGAASDEA